MPRNMSFSKTTKQFRNRTKTVTRRCGWRTLKAGTVVCGCEKCMGLKPGEKLVRLGHILVVDVRTEPLTRMIEDEQYGRDEARKEGFPEMSGREFVEMFCEFQRVAVDYSPVRIEFIYV